jgi:flagellar basal body-associated protein FliL
MRRRSNGLGDKPWVIIAAVVGVIAVAAIALVFFMGSGDTSGKTPSGTTTTVPTAGTTPGSQVSGTLTIKPTVAVTIPPTGVFVKVSYIGSFNGAYGTNGAMVNVKNSGDRVYEVVNATGNFTASFSKQDGSTKHDITVELWKNGKSLASAQNTTPFGKASLTYKL